MRPIVLSFAFFFFSACMVVGQEINIIPQPVSVKQPKIAANFNLTAATIILLEGSGLENSANFFNDYLDHFYHYKLKIEKTSN
jgi:hexosaminidase